MKYVIVRSADADMYEWFLRNETTWTTKVDDARTFDTIEEATSALRARERRDSHNFFTYYVKRVK